MKVAILAGGPALRFAAETKLKSMVDGLHGTYRNHGGGMGIGSST